MLLEVTETEAQPKISKTAMLLTEMTSFAHSARLKLLEMSSIALLVVNIFQINDIIHV